MEKSYSKILSQIIDLKSKDTLPENATMQIQDEHYEKVSIEVKNDYSSLPIDQFNKKYDKYLNTVKKKPTEVYKKPRAVNKKAEKSLEEIEKEEKEKEEQRKQTFKNLQEKYPPNTRFFSCTNMDEDKWHRYEKMPTDEFLETKKSIRWTGGMIGSAATYLGSFVLVAIHKDYRVIEFEYMYDGDKLYNPSF